MRGKAGGEPGMLNKITGCESRTVPPLYVLTGRSQAKAGHWGNLGRPIFSADSSAGHESEDLRIGLCTPADYGICVFVAEKRLRHHFLVPQFLIGGIQMKNKKQILIAVLVLCAVIGLLLGVYFGSRPETAQGEKHISVTVVHKDGTQKVFSYDTDEEYLGPVLLAEGLVEGEEGPYGLTISAVDGETADWNVDQSYWALFIGEEYATTGADTTPVNDGDSFKLVYTIG